MFDFRWPGVICTFLSCAMEKPLKAFTIHQTSDTSPMGTWWMLSTHWQMKKVEFLWCCTKLTSYYYPRIFFSAITIVVKIKIGTTSGFQTEFGVFFLALACTPMIFSVPINVCYSLKFWQTSPDFATPFNPLFWFSGLPAGESQQGESANNCQ